MVSTSALLLGSSRPKLGWSRSSRFWQPTARSPVRLGHGGLRVSCVAAPEKPAAAEKPFTAWDTAVQRVAKRTDLKTIMLLGAGPIVIGQVGRNTAVARVGDAALRAPVEGCPALAYVRANLHACPTRAQACEFDYSGTQACKALK